MSLASRLPGTKSPQRGLTALRLVLGHLRGIEPPAVPVVAGGPAGRHRRLAALDVGDAPLAFGRIDRVDDDFDFDAYEGFDK